MADKVYGICGTNKCKREVIAKGDIGIAQGVMTVTGGTYDSVKLNYPDGFQLGNCLPLSAIVITPGGSGPITGHSGLRTYANLDSDGVYCGVDSPRATNITKGNYQCFVILMKCDYAVG